MDDTQQKNRGIRRAALVGTAFAALAAIGFSTKAIFVKLAYQEPVDAVTLLTLRMVFSLPVFSAVGRDPDDWFRKDGADRFPGPGDHPVPGPCVPGRILCPAANPGFDAGHGWGAGHFPETQGGVTLHDFFRGLTGSIHSIAYGVGSNKVLSTRQGKSMTICEW